MSVPTMCLTFSRTPRACGGASFQLEVFGALRLEPFVKRDEKMAMKRPLLHLGNAAVVCIRHHDRACVRVQGGGRIRISHRDSRTILPGYGG